MKRGRGLALLCSLLLFLSGCGSRDSDVLARVGQTSVRLDDYLALADLYRKMPDAAGHLEKLAPDQDEAKRLLDNLVWEKMAEVDLARDLASYEAAYGALQQAANEAFGSEQGLEAQLDTLDISKEAFAHSLRLQAMTAAHRQRVATAHAPTEEDLHRYFDQHPKERALVSYRELWVPTRKEAEALEKGWQDGSSPKVREDLNTDPFEQTGYRSFDQVGIRSEGVISQKIFEQKVGTSHLYKREGLYHVVYVDQRLENYDQVRKHLLSLYEEDQYLSYLGDLAKELGVRIYYDRLPVAKETPAAKASSGPKKSK